MNFLKRAMAQVLKDPGTLGELLHPVCQQQAHTSVLQLHDFLIISPRNTLRISLVSVREIRTLHM